MSGVKKIIKFHLPGVKVVKDEVCEPDTNSMALDRTVLANERTFQAWIRTGLAALVSGLGVAKFLRDVMPLSMLLILVSVLILFSMLAFLLSAWRYSHLHLRIEPLDIDATPLWLVRSISIVLASCSIFALVGLLIVIS